MQILKNLKNEPSFLKFSFNTASTGIFPGIKEPLRSSVLLLTLLHYTIYNKQSPFRMKQECNKYVNFVYQVKGKTYIYNDK